MKLLNPGYETNQDLNSTGETITVNNSLYWNSGSGTCYNEQNNGTKKCDFTNSGLSDEAKGYVVDQTIYLGGFDTYNVFANSAYILERNNNVIQNPSDGITRTTRWTGKVGLPNPSDFGYAADFRDSNCQGDLSTLSSCSANWMKKTSVYWSITPYYNPYDNSNNNKKIMGISDVIFLYSVHLNNYVYPTLLLDQTVEIESGNGTKETPYVVAY